MFGDRKTIWTPILTRSTWVSNRCTIVEETERGSETELLCVRSDYPNGRVQFPLHRGGQNTWVCGMSAENKLNEMGERQDLCGTLAALGWVSDNSLPTPTRNKRLERKDWIFVVESPTAGSPGDSSLLEEKEERTLFCGIGRRSALSLGRRK